MSSLLQKMDKKSLETLSYPPGWGMMWEEERLFQLEGMHDDHLFQLPDDCKCGQKFRDIMQGIVQMNTDRSGSWPTSPGSL